MNHPLDRTRKAKNPMVKRRRVILQLDLFPVLLAQSEEEADDDLLTQRITWGRADKLSIPKEARRVASSVFDLASSPVKVHMQHQGKHCKNEPVYSSRVIHKDGGLLRVMVHQEDTPKWQEREFQRRARQVVPRPSKSIVTTSEKLKKMQKGG